jgi:dipeptidyl aminopeptidase/acylaminoacyl peptidase
MNRLRSGACLPLALTLLVQSVGYGQRQRPMTVADLFTLEQLGPVVASPNGEWLAVVIARPRSASEIYRDFPWGPADADHADIWLVPRSGGERRNITRGSSDGSGYWSPVWSPDGKRLALLSTKGGDDIRPYIWDMDSGTLRKLTERGFDVLASGDESWPSAPLIWADDTTLICPLRRAGAPPPYYSMTKLRSMSVALDAWTRAAGGKVATGSVLNSGGTDGDTMRPRGELVTFDVVSGKSRVLAESNSFSLMLSPTRRHLAMIAENGPRPPLPTRKLVAYKSLTEEWWHTRLMVAPLAEHVKPLSISDVTDPIVGSLSFLGDHPAAWSPNGSSFAVVGRVTAHGQTAMTVFVVDVVRATVQRLKDQTLEVQRTAWSTDGELLALARRRMSLTTAQDSTRWDWWLIDPRTMSHARNLTTQLPAAPEMLIRCPERHYVMGLVKGDLWAIDLRNGATINLTRGQGPRIETIVWPARSQWRLQSHKTLVVRANGNALYRVDWQRGLARMSLLRIPVANAELADFRPTQGSAVFTSAAPNGVFLWSGDTETGRYERRLTLNPQLGRIAAAQRRLIEYRGSEGDSLKAVLLLPINYQPGTRYPLISWVYPGTIVTDTAGHFELDAHHVTSLNLNLLAAHGYAVLMPSIPLRAEGPPSEPYLDLPKGVMPAIDKVIDLGIADPGRLGVMGHSYGGYGTIALVTYSDRFKAAIAFAAPSDLMSMYGAVWPSMRYDPYPDDEFFFAALAESGQDRMGGPPWVDIGRYQRNSPFYYVERIRTPIMLIHGDMDYVPLQQSEQLFTALRRLGKRAAFVRYWGEGHIISSPANITDMWQRVLVWLDTYLRASSEH